MYYACDAYMMRDFGRAQRRAQEVRDELIGIVQQPVVEAKDKLSATVLSPIGSAKDTLTRTWNEGVNTVFTKASGHLKPAAPAASSPAKPVESEKTDV